MKGNDVNYWEVVFGENDTGNLAVPACHKTCLAHTISLDHEVPLVFYTLVIWGHKTFASLAPYLLLVHVSKFLANCFSPLFAKVFVMMIPSFVECLGFFRYKLGVIGHIGQIN